MPFVRANRSHRQLMERALAKPAADYEAAVLRREAMFGRAGADEQREALDRAAELATTALAVLRRDHGQRPVEDYLEPLGVKLIEVTEKDPFAYPYFGIYDQKRRTIELNTKLVKAVEGYLTELGLPHLVDDGQVRRLAVAHEIMHRLEPAPVRYGWRQRHLARRDEAVGEVAAVQFSQALADLPHSPCVYEVAAGLAGGNPRPLEVYDLTPPAGMSG